MLLLAAVVSAVVGGFSDKRIRAPVLHDASQMTTAGVEVAPHYHQLLVYILRSISLNLCDIFILDLVLERLSRSLMTAFRF